MNKIYITFIPGEKAQIEIINTLKYIKSNNNYYQKMRRRFKSLSSLIMWQMSQILAINKALVLLFTFLSIKNKCCISVGYPDISTRDENYHY